ncbi:hypothetical protein BJV82DRAFT_607434 [Fennellomyces sp. T-0311]|nr:hypothetical protein BJV82DRAFT_607434 [Fennellomyces sp. T-0311]
MSSHRAASVAKHRNPAPRSSNSSPYPGRPSHKLQPKNDRSKQPSFAESEFPTLVEDAPDKRHDGRSAWSDPNAIRTKVLCPPSSNDENSADLPMSPYDVELERVKALVPKRLQPPAKRLSHHHHSPSSPLISPTPSRSLSSSQRMRSAKPTVRTTSSGASSNSSLRTSPLTKQPLQMPSREAAVVKLPMSSKPKRASSGSSVSSSHSQLSACDLKLEAPPRICELTDDTTTTSSSSLLESPRTLMEEDMMEAPDPRVMDMQCVDDHEKEHFVSWIRTWASRPAVKAAMEASVINPRFFGGCGEYSYFGRLGCE